MFRPDGSHISFTVDITKPKREQVIITSRSLKNYTTEQLCYVLLDQTPILNKILSTDDVNEQIEIFNNIFNYSLDICAPITTREIKRPSAPWIKDELKLEINERDMIQKRLKENRQNERLNIEYKQKKK